MSPPEYRKESDAKTDTTKMEIAGARAGLTRERRGARAEDGTTAGAHHADWSGREGEHGPHFCDQQPEQSSNTKLEAAESLRASTQFHPKLGPSSSAARAPSAVPLARHVAQPCAQNQEAQEAQAARGFRKRTCCRRPPAPDASPCGFTT
eukprot:scaffold10152_cov45-Phaeocystis_antarctica.AAC.1